MSALSDDALRRRALAIVGPYGDPLAREALEAGELLVGAIAASWEGSLGAVSGRRIVLRSPRGIHARVVASEPSGHVARDTLGAAVAAAIAERPGEAMAELAFEEGAPRGAPGGPYRG